MSMYDWSGLLYRRIALFAGLLLIYPGSLVAWSRYRGGEMLLVGSAVLALNLDLLRRWSCPRCARGFGRRAGFPWVRPMARACSSCGIREFSPSPADAPPFDATEPAGPVASRRRLPVSLLLVLPLVYMAMCRLPDGVETPTAGGGSVRVLGMERRTWRSSQASSTALALRYYAPSAGRAVAPEDLLALTLPTLRQNGDSTVVLEEVRSDWWLRNAGLWFVTNFPYQLEPDGTWRPYWGAVAE